MEKSGAKFAKNFFASRSGSYQFLCCCWFKSYCQNLLVSSASTSTLSGLHKPLLRCAGVSEVKKLSSNILAVQSGQCCVPLFYGKLGFMIKGTPFSRTSSGKFSASEINLLKVSESLRENCRFLRYSSNSAMEDRRSRSEGSLNPILSVLEASDEIPAEEVRQASASAGRADSTELRKADYRESVLVNRNWKLTELGEAYERVGYRPSAHHGNLEFTIASYNVLAQNLLEDNSYLYEHSSSAWLQWPFRWQNLLNELKRHQPDILCCQEINAEHYIEFFSPELEKLGYKGEFKKRTRKMRDGCATFYKTSLFDCLSVFPIEYLRPGVSALDRDNVAMILMLRPKQVPGTSTQLCVANTHLLFNPRRGDVKLAQMMMLFAEIDKIAFRHHQASPSGLAPVYHPIILCGDLNMEPFSQLYRFVSSGNLPVHGATVQKLSKPIPLTLSAAGQHWKGSDRQLSYEFLDPEVGISDYSQYLEVCRARRGDLVEDDDLPREFVQGSGHVAHQLGFRSVYRHYMDYGTGHYAHRLPEVSTSHSRANCTVDYIFYSSGSAHINADYSEKLQLISRLSLLSTKEMHHVGGLPNEFASSDHLMLSARFFLKIDKP